MNFVRGKGSSSNYVNLWGICKEISWTKKIIPAKIDQHKISPILVGDLVNTGWQIGQYRLAIWPIPVGDFVNTGWRIGQYRLANWPIPVGDFANTGEGTFSKIWAGSRSKSKILKTWRVLELCLDMESSIKKKSIFLFPCPFKRWVLGPLYRVCVKIGHTL